MKINPPVPEIPPDDPYLHDLFARKDFGDSLTSVFRNLEENVVLCVDAPWGDGKTTFANMWIASLRHQKINCIYYDAYEHDYTDDPFVSFCAEIISLAETAFGGDDGIQGLKDDLRTKAKRIGGKLLSTGARIGLKALTLGILKDSDVDALESIRSDLASSSSAAASTLIEHALEDYTSDKNCVDEFRKKLAELGGAVRSKQKFPLLIVIDELDRCRPDFALALIERIKHLFATPNVSFLLLVNMAQLENYVKTVYGADVDARNYLHKFITLSTKLPKNVLGRYNNNYFKYFQRLVEHYGIDLERGFDDILIPLFQHYGFTLREVERCFSILALYYSQLRKGRLTIGAAIAFLSVMRVRDSPLFNELAEGQLSYESLAEKTDIEGVDATGDLGFPKSYVVTLLKFLLLTDNQYNKLGKDDDIRGHEEFLFSYGCERKRVIPFFCEELSKFRIENG